MVSVHETEPAGESKRAWVRQSRICPLGRPFVKGWMECLRLRKMTA